jgi:ABC-type nitrate/sulfonate/bicarbonate transport system permease component
VSTPPVERGSIQESRPGTAPRSRETLPSRGTVDLLIRFAVKVAISIISVLLLWFAWWAIVTITHPAPYVACTPNQAFAAITSNWSSLRPLVWQTVKQTVDGLIAGTVCGFALAVLMSRLRLVEQLIYPTIITSQAIPIIALAPILVLIFSYTLTPIVIVVALFVFFPITINTLGAFKAVDRDLLDLARVLGARRWRRFMFIEVPSVVPGFLSGLKIGSVYAVSGAIIAQLYDTTGSSLAFNQQRAAIDLSVPLAYGDTIVMTALSLLSFLLAVAIGFVATPWLHRDIAPWRPWAGRTGSVE